MNEQKCPICGVGFLKKKVIEENFEYKGKTLSVPDYIVYACGECGEAIVDQETLRKSGELLKKYFNTGATSGKVAWQAF